MDDFIDSIIRGDCCPEDRRRQMMKAGYNDETVKNEVNRRLNLKKYGSHW